MISDAICQRLKQATNVVVFTGAGASAESGIQTFRNDSGGLWKKFNPNYVASPDAFKAHPQIVWDWYCCRAEVARKAVPNPCHIAVAVLQNFVDNVCVVTQNVDGLHQKAGSRNVLELHGNLFRLKPFIDQEATFSDELSPYICRACNGDAWGDPHDPYADQGDFEKIALAPGKVPRCPACHVRLRPDVTWFGEQLDPQILMDAFSAVSECDVLLCIGCSLEVQPAASLPYMALEHGAVVIEINPQATDLSPIAHASYRGTAGTVLPKLVRDVWLDRRG